MSGIEETICYIGYLATLILAYHNAQKKETGKVIYWCSVGLALTIRWCFDSYLYLGG